MKIIRILMLVTIITCTLLSIIFLTMSNQCIGEDKPVSSLYINSKNIVPVISIQAVRKMSFQDDRGKEVGMLDWSDGTIKFFGSFDKSAKLFFEYFWKDYIEGSILQDPVAMSKILNKMGFVVVTKEQWEEMNKTMKETNEVLDKTLRWLKQISKDVNAGEAKGKELLNKKISK